MPALGATALPGHTRQRDELVAGAYRPAVQGVHAALPQPAANLPAAQPVHVLALSAPAVVEPGGHAEQSCQPTPV